MPIGLFSIIRRHLFPKFSSRRTNTRPAPSRTTTTMSSPTFPSTFDSLDPIFPNLTDKQLGDEWPKNSRACLVDPWCMPVPINFAWPPEGTQEINTDAIEGCSEIRRPYLLHFTHLIATKNSAPGFASCRDCFFQGKRKSLSYANTSLTSRTAFSMYPI